MSDYGALIAALRRKAEFFEHFNDNEKHETQILLESAAAAIAVVTEENRKLRAITHPVVLGVLDAGGEEYEYASRHPGPAGATLIIHHHSLELARAAVGAEKRRVDAAVLRRRPHTEWEEIQ